MEKLQLNDNIEPKLKSLMQQLIILDEETQRLDRILKDIRVGIFNTLWSLMETKNKENP